MDTLTTYIGDNSKEELRAVVERIEELVGQRVMLNADINHILAEAKANGFDKATIREVLKARKLPKQELEEKEHLRDLYLTALGVL